jgi:hypothetical protein
MARPHDIPKKPREELGFMFSGTEPGESFTEGWALKIFGGNVAHYWRRRPGGNSGWPICTGKIVPLRLRNGQTGLLYPGDFPLCKRCEAKLRRRA